MELTEQEKEWEAITATAEKARLSFARALIHSDKETSLEDFLLKQAEGGNLEGCAILASYVAALPPSPELYEKLAAAMRVGIKRKRGDPLKRFMPDNTFTDHACAFLVAFWDKELRFKSVTLPPLAVWSYGAIAELFEAFGLEGNWTNDKKFTKVRKRVNHYGLQLSQTILVNGLTIHWAGGFFDGLDRQVEGYKLQTCCKARNRKRQAAS